MLYKIVIYLGLVDLALCFFHGEKIPIENEPPKVVVTKPSEKTKLPRNSIIPYSIHVNDPEDGNSDYDEIAIREVLLMVRYLPNSTDLESFLKKGKDMVPEPLLMMSKSTCLNCHASKSKLIGPSFELIAQRYSEEPKAKEVLIQKIISGATGTWGDLKMPPHPDMEVEEVSKIVDWILNNGAIQNQTFYVGTEGAFRTNGQVNQGAVYALTASYMDHGINDMVKSNKLGWNSIILNCE